MSTGGASASATGNALGVASVGRYEILHRIAAGGMAVVYLGRARGVGGFERVVAVKCCHPQLLSDEQFVTMFLDEARLAAQIHHPNVVATLDVGHEGDALYLVMEYVQGAQLSDLLEAARARDGALPIPVALRVLVDALAGLHAAHETCDADGRRLNIVHRDVTPHNLLVGADGVARLTDFGIARAEMRATVTRRGVFKGKLSYAAPELLAPDAVATQRADVFAAGIVLWESLTARALFRGRNDAETARLVMRGEIAPPSSVAPRVSAALDAVVMKALARDPAARFQTAAAFADAIEACGERVAGTREVAAYVQEALAPRLAAQRELLREARARAGASPSLPPPSAATPAPPAQAALPATPATAPAPAPRRRARAAVVLVLAVVAVVAGAVAAVATHAPQRATHGGGR